MDILRIDMYLFYNKVFSLGGVLLLTLSILGGSLNYFAVGMT